MSETNTKPGSPRTTKFTPPKGYGGFIPVIDEVAEGEWTLGVAPAPQNVISPPTSSGVSRAPRPKDAAAIAATKPVGSTTSIHRSAGVSAAATQTLRPPQAEHPLTPASKAPATAEAPAARKSLDDITLRSPAVPLQGTLERYNRGTEVASPSPRRSAIPPSASTQPRSRSTILWVAVVALALGLAGETWYVMHQQNIQLSRLPGIARVASALGVGSGSLGGSPSAPAEQKVSPGSPDIPPTTSIPAAAPPTTSSADTSASHASAAAAQNPAGRQMASTAASPPVPLGQSKASGVASQTTAKPQRKVDREARHPVQTRPKELASAAGLGVRAAQDRAAAPRPAAPAAAPANRPRVDFEVATNSAREIVPGISLRVTATNVREQRYDGYLWLMSDGSALWLSNVAVERPIVFYPRHGGQADSMVITRITRDTVVGYLLQPVNGIPTQGANSPSRSQATGLYAGFTPARKKSR